MTGSATVRLPREGDHTDFRRQQLIDAAMSSIAENGLARTTVARVAEGAGLSQGIMNFYFEGKQALLLAVFRQPGKTAGEYAAITGIDRVMVGRRLLDLKGDGLIEQSTPRICQVHGTRMMTWRPATEPEETQTELF